MTKLEFQSHHINQNKRKDEIMKKIKQDITDIKRGVIVHQVNCQNVIGKGLSGAICKKYPIVKEKYHEMFASFSKQQIHGKIQLVEVSDDLIVANLFTQYYYGNAYKTKKVYTDVDLLVKALTTVAQYFENVYVPENIGCGLGGANWDDVYHRIKHLPITLVSL